MIARHANASTQSQTRPSDASRFGASVSRDGTASNTMSKSDSSTEARGFLRDAPFRAASTTRTTALGENPSIWPAILSTSTSDGGAGLSEPDDLAKHVAINRALSKEEGIGTFNNWSKAAKPSVARDRNARRRRDGLSRSFGSDNGSTRRRDDERELSVHAQRVRGPQRVALGIDVSRN